MISADGRKIYIIIATHGKNSLLGRTLESLAGCFLPAGLQKVFVVENGIKYSAEDIVGLFTHALPLQYLYHPVANKSSALNVALEKVDDGLILFFDDDVRFVPDTIMAYSVGTLQTGPNSFWGGPLRVDYEVPPLDWLKEFLPRSAKGWSLKGAEIQRPDWFLGANWAAMACDLRGAGGFDEGFGPGSLAAARGQETNMQTRLRNLGLAPKYISGAIVYHYVPKERCSLEWLCERRQQEGNGRGLRSNKRALYFRLAIYCFSMVAILYNFLKKSICKAMNLKNKANYFNTRISYYQGMIGCIKLIK